MHPTSPFRRRRGAASAGARMISRHRHLSTHLPGTTSPTLLPSSSRTTTSTAPPTSSGSEISLSPTSTLSSNSCASRRPPASASTGVTGPRWMSRGSSAPPAFLLPASANSFEAADGGRAPFAATTSAALPSPRRGCAPCPRRWSAHARRGAGPGAAGECRRRHRRLDVSGGSDSRLRRRSSRRG